MVKALHVTKEQQQLEEVRRKEPQTGRFCRRATGVNKTGHGQPPIDAKHERQAQDISGQHRLETVFRGTDKHQQVLKKNPNHKGIVYSNYLASGIDPVAAEFKKRNIPYEKFTGELNDVKKREVVDKYNHNQTKALLLSGAGSEGLDLKGTRSIQVMEPHWHINRTEQLIGRGIRYGSHSALPENERNVRVIKYHSIYPESKVAKFFHRKPYTSADQYLEHLGGDKQKLLNQFLDVFKEEGSKNG